MAELILRSLEAQPYAGGTLLDAVQGENGQVELFFTHDSTIEADALKLVATIELERSIGNAPWMTVRTADIAARKPEHDFLRDRNVLVGLRNCESASVVADWVAFHAREQEATGIVLIDRAQPDDAKAFANRLAAHLPDGVRVIHLCADHPLGQRDLPDEAHPFCTPGAPGKDRMDVPAADPWSSPLAEVLIYEIVRHRFLAKARAIANLDICDLAPKQGEVTLFDAAIQSDTGQIALVGRQCYPWRVRDGDAPHFGDHICVQFDARKPRLRWCVTPSKLDQGVVLRLVRVGGAAPGGQYPFFRCMAVRHRTDSVSRIVPKTSLVHHEPLIAMARRVWGRDPVLMPEEKVAAVPRGDNSVCIVTTMKNEGPFILEWIAYHRAIGIENFLVYTNDCTDGTDTLLDLLQSKGLVQHRENPFRSTDLKPQHAALQAAEREDIVTGSDWMICMDVDEFVNVKAGEGTMKDLFAAMPGANLISCTWRLFGNDDVHDFDPRFVIAQFDRCAPELARKPHQAWGFKTFVRNVGLFKKFGVHRPKGLKPQIWDKIRWYNGSGRPMPREEYRNAWRSNVSTYGYDLVQLNHYAVRSAESFLVKRDRGRVNHVDRDQGLAYWFRMNNNAEQEGSIQRMLPLLEAEFDRLLSDPDIRAQHEACIAAHRAKIDELKASPTYTSFYQELTSPRMERLSRLHDHFGANVFLAGPECVPDDIVERDPEEEFFFTVDRRETAH